MPRLFMAIFMCVALIGGMSAAAAEEHAAPAAAGEAQAIDSAPHPRMPAHPTWVPRMIGVVALMFLFAIPAGMVRSMYRREEPVVADLDAVSHSHEAHEHTSAGLDKHGAHDPHAGHGGHH